MYLLDQTCSPDSDRSSEPFRRPALARRRPDRSKSGHTSERSAVHEFGPLVEDLRTGGDERRVRLLGPRPERRRTMAVLERQAYPEIPLDRRAHGITGHHAQE